MKSHNTPESVSFESTLPVLFDGGSSTLSGHPVVGTVAAMLAKCQGLFNKRMWTQLTVYVTSWDEVWNSIFQRQKISSHHLESLL